MPDFKNLLLIAVLSLAPGASLSAMPLVSLPQGGSDPDIIKVQTMCDARGCFTYGRTQSFRPAYMQPNYRPPTATGPTYYRPRAQGAAPLYYNTKPVQTVRPQTPGKNFHVQWCRNQYRTYNPKTDRFLTYEGIYKTCSSPYD